MSTYNFATIDGIFFCYLDGQKFQTKLELLKHIVFEHRGDQDKLKAWGMSYRAIGDQANYLTGQQTIQLFKRQDRKKRHDKEIKKQSIQLVNHRNREKREMEKLAKDEKNWVKK